MRLEKNDCCLFLDVNGEAYFCPPTVQDLIHQGFMHNSVHKKNFLANGNCFLIYSELSAKTEHPFILSLTFTTHCCIIIIFITYTVGTNRNHGPRQLVCVLIGTFMLHFIHSSPLTHIKTLEVSYICYWTGHLACGPISSSWSLTECVCGVRRASCHSG